MTAFTVVASAILGLAVGSFCNVVIYRVPEKLSVVKPRSFCPTCGEPVRSIDNIPVVSWLVLGGRCRNCREPISARYVVVELATATLFALLAFQLGPSLALPAFFVLAGGLVAISAIDLERYIVPNRVLYPTLFIGAPLLALAGIAAGSWSRLFWAAAGGVAAFSAMYLVHVIQPKGMGFGDVRLSGLLGVYLGWFGPARVGVGFFLAFLFGSVGGLVLVILGRKTARAKVPFAPFLAGGAMFSILWGAPIVKAWLG